MSTLKAAAQRPARRRRPHAALALRPRSDPTVFSGRLGQATVSITLDIYSYAIPALQEEAAALIAALVFGEPAATP